MLPMITIADEVERVRVLLDEAAGELTARELNAHGIEYTHFAHPTIYTNMCGSDCEAKMAIHWAPYLEGKRSIVESLSALVATFK